MHISVNGDKATCSFCWGFNNSCTALIPAFHCVQWHLPLFCTQLVCCSDLSSRKVPLKVLEVGLRSSGLVPAADAVLWLLYEPVFKGTAFSHQFFLLPSTFQMCRQKHCTKIALESHPLSDSDLHVVQVVFLKSWIMCYICTLLNKLPARETSRASKGSRGYAEMSVSNSEII